MDTEIKKALIYGATIFVAVSVWCVVDSYKSHLNRYEIHSAGVVGITFLLDRQTGAVWRYYRNTDSTGKLTDEGFSLIQQPLNPK